jgi:two-component sensor histidine kinase
MAANLLKRRVAPTKMGERWIGKPRTIGWHLIVFAAALYLPVLGLTGLLGAMYVEQQHEEIRQRSLYVARALDGKLTQTIGTFAAVAHALSVSRALQTADFQEFHRQATAAIKEGAWLVVLDRTGQQVVNTRVPWGTQLPATPHPALPKIFAGDSYISDLMYGTVAGQSVISSTSPVRNLGTGDIIYAITIVFSPEVVLAAIEGETPPEWHTVIMDRRGIIIARVPLHSERVGKLATASTLEDIASVTEGQEGFWSANIRTVEGYRVIGAFRRMSSLGWVVGVSAPPSVFDQAFYRAIWIGAAILCICLILPPLVAFMTSARIRQAMNALRAKAEALEEGRVVEPPVTPLIEVNEVALTMHRAAVRLQREAQHQRLLALELNHRVKNSLTSVQAIARRTFRGENQEKVGKFEGRILAMSQTHNLLTASQWSGVHLIELLKLEIFSYSDRIVLRGEDMVLSPRAAVSFGLLFHELVTNAVKYGALSVPEGRVEITWTVEQKDEERNVDIIWNETGGPPVTQPTRKGFGTTLIQSSIQHELQGAVDLTYEPLGVQCRISVKLLNEKPVSDALAA